MYQYDIIERGNKFFPVQLYDLQDVPKQLYIMGNKDVLKEFSIGVVGARGVSQNGRSIAEKICDGLSKNQIPLVSGFAYGVDTVAHTMAIQNHQKTIVVLAGGFHHIYPKENISLIEPILKNGGAIICEHDVDVAPLRKLFAKRNRMIAALGRGLVVIEAGEKSGSLITARQALQIKRNLYVVPGGIYDENYYGSNRLLMNGAKCILGYQDIMNDYENLNCNEIELSKREKIVPQEYDGIYHYLIEPKNVIEIAKHFEKSISSIHTTLTLMELEGYIKKIAGNCFIQA